MRIIITVTLDPDATVSKAGFHLYADSGAILVSETSSVRNVAKRSPQDVFEGLLAQALKEADSVPDPTWDDEPY